MSSSLHDASSHALAPYGWDDEWQAQFMPYAERGLVPGRVTRVDRGLCDVVTEAGTVRAGTDLVTPREPMRMLCTGDWAAVEPVGDPPLVQAYLPRRTQFVRSTSSKRSEGQVLAANVGHAVVVVSLAGDLDLGRVERFLALAWESGAIPVVALTMSDLVEDPEVLAHLVHDVETAAPGTQVLAASSVTGQGVDLLAAALAGSTGALLGTSGAGKSSLVNALLGTEAATVQAVRDVDHKGRHTTTTRTLHALPGGGMIMDTPGIRGVGLWDAEDGVGRAFADIDDLARRCRFHDCAHESEPGCAVLGAVAEGELSLRRLESHRKLMRENRHIAARTDARLRAELRREWKARGAQGRADAEAKRGGRGR